MPYVKRDFAAVCALGADPYYEGDRAHPLDIEVPQRPSSFHSWDGARWVLDQPAKDAVDAKRQREADDEVERAANKADAQIQSDLNMTIAEVGTLIDTLFAGWTAPQRLFMKRLTRIVLAAARKVLR